MMAVDKDNTGGISLWEAMDGLRQLEMPENTVKHIESGLRKML